MFTNRGYVFMKCLHRIVLLVVAAASVALSAGIDIAIMDLEPLGAPPEQVRKATEILRTQFTQHPLFQVIERGRLSELLEEQKLQLSGLTSAGKAVEVGNVLNVRKLVFGSVAATDSRYVKYLLTIRMVDVENGAVELAENIDVAAEDDWREACTKLVAAIAGKMDIAGSIRVIRDDGIYTDIGTPFGVAESDVLAVAKLNVVRDKQGAILMREKVPVGILRIESIDANGSRCAPIDSAMPFEVGMRVQPATGEAGEAQDAVSGLGSISVQSVPTGARAFVDGELVGLTPARIDSVAEGAYALEIRHGGYRTYRAKIRVRCGRTVIVQRDLEKVVDIEDLIGGKVPRRQTDPSRALVWSLLPGGGQIYNGYQTQAIMTQLQIAGAGATAGLLFALASRDRSEADVSLPATPDTWDYIDKYAGESTAGYFTLVGAFMAGYAGVVYLYSILDSYLAADDPFMQTQYGHARLWPYVYLYRGEQTSDDRFSTGTAADYNSAVSDIDGTAWGGSLTLGHSTHRFDILMDIGFGPDAMLFGLEGHCKVPVRAGLSLDGGIAFTGNLSEPSDATEDEEPVSALNTFFAPVLGLSYGNPHVVARADFSPWARATGNMFVIENDADQWWETTSVGGLEGIYAKGALDVFFGSRAGVSAACAFLSLEGKVRGLEREGLSVIDSHRDILIRLGPVFRF
ncbi:MAG: PEGA domain-containing protein [Chitinivibrionales bacterium]|nr:PEGA domain-containing protein [Chitinivibrionales bacterium]MBD3395813.1 PEGA domain-containing protein [Chitinivibrionales bacterium]